MWINCVIRAIRAIYNFRFDYQIWDVLGALIGVCLLGGMFFIDVLPILWLTTVYMFVWAAMFTVFIIRLFVVPSRDRGGIIRLRHVSMNSRGNIVMKVVIVGPFVIAGLYALHLLCGSSLSVHATKLSTYSWLFYGAVALMLMVRVAKYPLIQRQLNIGWVIMASVLVLSALSTVYGIVPVPFAILRTSDPAISEVGARLGGLVQYPNFFGSIMGAIVVERLLVLTKLSGPAAKKYSNRLQAISIRAMVMLSMTCLLLSESRGAYAATAAGWAAGWLLLPAAQRQRYLLHTCVFTAAGALLRHQLAAAQLAPPLAPGLLVLAATLAAALALSGLVARIRPAFRRAMRLGCAAALLLAGSGALGAGVPERLFRLETLTARLAMYADALRLFMASPWVGHGGDAWGTAYRSIQSHPYVGSEVHGGYIDIALDLGIIGLAAFLIWLGVIVWLLYTTKSTMLAPVLILLLHSTIDFDMSFGLFWLLLIWLTFIGITESSLLSFSPSRYKLSPYKPSTYKLSLDMANPSNTNTVPSPISWGAGASAIVLTLTVTAGAGMGVQLAEGLRLQHQAMEIKRVEATDASKSAAALLRRSLHIDPSRLGSRLALAELLPAEEAIRLLEEGRRYYRAAPQLLLALGTTLANEGDVRAVYYFRQAVKLDPFSTALQTEVLEQVAALSEHCGSQGQYAQARAVAAEGYRMYQKYVRLSGSFTQPASGRNDRRFKLTEDALAIGKRLQPAAGK